MVIKGLRRPLPIPLPRPADRRIHACLHQPESQSAVVLAAVVLKPCGLIGILVQVVRADMVVLPDNHPAQAREIAFGPIGVLAVVAVNLAMVHPVNGPDAVKHVPVAGLVG